MLFSINTKWTQLCLYICLFMWILYNEPVAFMYNKLSKSESESIVSRYAFPHLVALSDRLRHRDLGYDVTCNFSPEWHISRACNISPCIANSIHVHLIGLNNILVYMQLFPPSNKKHERCAHCCRKCTWSGNKRNDQPADSQIDFIYFTAAF